MSPQPEAKGPFSIAAFDVDGTLTDSSGVIDPAVIELLSDLIHSGVLVVIATARGPGGAKTIAKHTGELWAVTYQGALMGTFNEAKWITHSEITLDLEAAHHICDLAATAGLATSWHVGESWFTTALTDEVVRESTIVADSPVVVADHRQLSEAPHKLMFISPPHQIAKLEELSGVLPSSVDHSYSHPNYLEVSASGVNKGTALADLISVFRGRTRDAVAFGDGPNDVAMFGTVGHSVAMAHASESVRVAASAVAAEGLIEAVRALQWRTFEAT